MPTSISDENPFYSLRRNQISFDSSMLIINIDNELVSKPLYNEIAKKLAG